MADSAPVFLTPDGPLRGHYHAGLVRASGIRYARAARFQPPTDELAHPELRPATAPGPVCPQVPDPVLQEAMGPALAGRTFDEDCLRLTVTAPPDYQAGPPRAVLVWIHGGSYVSGAGDLAFYDPTPLVREQGLVVVAVSYRLGMLGFLGHQHAPANLGLLDLLAALRWVQRNIAAFGGNPSCVTLLGHSSGADAAAHLMLAEGAAGLFRRVILHSAPLGLAPGRARMGRAMAAAVAPLPPHAPLEQVLAAQPRAERAARWSGLKAGMPFGVQYGASPLPPEPAADAAWQAAAPHFDVLIGATTDELRFFAVAAPGLRRLLALPRPAPALLQALVRAGSRRIYVGPAAAFARRHARAGGQAYLFRVPYHPVGSEFGGAHTIDLPLLFGSAEAWAPVPLLGQATWPEVEAAGRPVRQFWADFARTGHLPVPIHLPGILEVQQVQ
ncbi:carboxylesterase family protein [Hymenobacter metallilatus]|uniref:Carboxylic ester hydrolase n=1 Tax=Hymenobacter metallilatus TaxID=2493666 RepID=A0A428JRM4_9BACT|nr:carboxylesterase family protein [Hymenobacter metallilatus]RSK36214.1 carboxylesterase/lipase family protein [Hymenobacter metallilatus]